MRARNILLTVLLCAGALAQPVAAQQREAQVSSAHASDEAAIRKLGVTWQDSWNRRDAAGLASITETDVVFVSVLGPDTPGQGRGGRAAFEAAHAAMLKGPAFTNSRWTTRDVSVVRWLGDNVAVAHVVWETTGDVVRHLKPGTPRRGIFTWTLHRQPDGRWLVAASQNTEVMPPFKVD